jgi:uncharacterized membrane protein YkvA (DUF1232 family)
MQKVLYGEILDPEPPQDRAKRNEKRVREGFKDKIRKVARHIPFAEEVVAAYYCALDPKTPQRARYILMGALAYFVMPVDWVPDFLAGFGFSDDIAVLTAAIAAIKANLTEGHHAAARRLLSGGDKS